MAADLLSTIQSEIDERLSELRPLLVEYEQLLVAVEALKEGSTPAAPKARRAPRAARPAAAPRGSSAGAAKLAAGEPAEQERQPVDGVRLPVDQAPQPIAEVETLATDDLAEPEAISKPAPAAAREAILAALDHGSHTVNELVVVTAMSAASITSGMRRLVADGSVVKTEREGKMAYALPA